MKDLVRVAGLILVGVLLVGAVGCVKNGSDGQPGAPGSTGTNVTVVTTPSTPNTVMPAQDLPGLKLTVTSLTGGSGAGGAFLPGDTISVHFTITKKDGSTLLVSELTGSGIIVSGPSFNYQHVIPRIKNFHTSVTTEEDGSYSYTFPSPIPATYANPDNYTGKYPDAVLAGQALLDGTYTLGIYASRTYYDATTSYSDVGNSETDFLLGGATTLEPREVVKNDNCNSCHATLQAHGGSRRDVKFCLLCHTSGGEDPAHAAAIDFRVMIHKLHNGAHLPSVQGVQTNPDGSRNYGATAAPYVVNDTDFSDINFPVWPSLNVAMPKNQGYSALSTTAKAQNDSVRTGVIACDKCHGDPDGAGPKSAPAQGSLCYSQPSRRACGSCHDDIEWTLPYASNSSTMPAQGNDAACVLCHVPSGTSFGTTEVHVHPLLDVTLNPGVKISLASVTGGSGGGGNFQAGDSPVLAFTVKNDAGADIPLSSLDSSSALLVGPTNKRQPVMPYTTPNGVSINAFDFTGRLASSSTTGKGTMSKVVGASVTEVLTVLFGGSTAFTVSGSSSGALGGGSLSASPSTNPDGSSISAVTLTAAAVAQQITVSFTDATNFTVTGSVSGAMGSGLLPASLGASTRFVAAGGSVAFNITVGTTNAFAAGNNIYMAVFKGAVANPVLFAIIAGRTSFAANDRFYYEAAAPASTYTYKIPMDIPLEFLGVGDGATTAFTAANLPVYFGRQSLSEVTATTAAVSAAAAIPAKGGRYIDMTAGSGIVAGDKYLLLDRAVPATRECLQLGLVETLANGNTRVWFKTPIRFARAVLPTVDRVTASGNIPLRLEGVAYTLNPATGVVTFAVAPPATSSIIMSYRTDGRFGWKRQNGDALQAVYAASINDSPDLGQDWGEWSGLSFLDGTYTVGLWGYRNLDLGQQNELQTYRCTANASTTDVLFGTATTIEPHKLVDSQAGCNACHSDLIFHGGGRRGLDTCLMCHSMAGAEDWPLYNPPTTAPTTPAGATPGVTIDFRTMLHKIHQGSDLANASTYTVAGNNGSASTYAEVGYPAMPGGTKHCDTCHGATNTAWKEPADRKHPAQTTGTRTWRAVCGSCHDSDATGVHINLMTDASGAESCSVCHGEGTEQAVELKHKNR